MALEERRAVNGGTYHCKSAKQSFEQPAAGSVKRASGYSRAVAMIKAGFSWLQRLHRRLARGWLRRDNLGEINALRSNHGMKYKGQAVKKSGRLALMALQHRSGGANSAAGAAGEK